jgi:3'-phosphoadenosine 5'-phosphosulfate sulfotransferase (PAPS reductase)/FAD synthetase
MQPIKDWLMKIRGDISGDDITMFTGIRAGESKRRSLMTEIEYMDFYDRSCSV